MLADRKVIDTEEYMADEKININGQEYDPEEVSNLIELGNKYRKVETDLNTPIDRLMPEYTKATQRAARADQLERELAERDKLLGEYKAKETKTVIPDDEKAQREYARKIGLADQDYLKEKGYMTKQEMEDFWTQKDKLKEETQTIISTGQRFEKEIDGSDGRAPYNAKATLAYATQFGFFQQGKGYDQALTEAYDEMNERSNAKWKDEQIEKTRRPGLTTLGPGGKKIPVEKKIETGDDLKNAWAEMFGE